MILLPNGDGLQFGNLLFFALQAHKFGIKIYDIPTRNDYWYKHFPKLLTLKVKLEGKYRRVTISIDYFQLYGERYSSEQLDDFIRIYLAQDAQNSLVENQKALL